MIIMSITPKRPLKNTQVMNPKPFKNTQQISQVLEIVTKIKRLLSHMSSSKSEHLTRFVIEAPPPGGFWSATLAKKTRVRHPGLSQTVTKLRLFSGLFGYNHRDYHFSAVKYLFSMQGMLESQTVTKKHCGNCRSDQSLSVLKSVITIYQKLDENANVVFSL